MWFTKIFKKIILLLLMVRCVNLKKPNVVLIVADDLRPNLGVYGYKTAVTPNIDKLASKSFIFKNAFAQQALCAPSRNSFLTSRRPDSLHLYDFYSYWRTVVGNFTTFPQHFKENGYYTHSIGKVFHPGISSNFSDDFPYSWSSTPYHPPTEIYTNKPVCVGKGFRLQKNLICPVIVEEQPGGTLPDLQSLDAAQEFLKYHGNITNNSSFFLAVGFHKPHIPFKFPAKYLKFHPLENITLPTNRWRPSLLSTVAWNPWTDLRERDDISALNISFPFGSMPDDVTKKIIQSYDSSVTYIDDLIGKLLSYIDSNTIIVLTSDHGWSLGEHGEFSKYSNFLEATKVPLVIHIPGMNTESVILDDLVELVDLFPTLVDLTQVSPSLKTCDTVKNTRLCTEGKSLVPMMYNAAKNKKKKIMGNSVAFTQYPRPGVYPTLKPNSDKPRLNEIKIMGYSVINNRYRYTEWVRFNHHQCAPLWNATVSEELYDHVIDGEENLNLAGRAELSYVVESLKKELRLRF